MQLDILKGIYTNEDVDFRSSLPLNLIPVPKDTGISKSYMRPAYGVLEFAVGPGRDRGSVIWNGVCYRAMGSKLVRLSSSGVIDILGDIGDDGNDATFAYSFDRLAVTSNGNLFYWNGASFQQVTDPDLGIALCVVWVDGYFMTTDGSNIVVTELNDPTSINPLKYGSSEIDPDPIVRLLKTRNEIYAINKNTIEVFDNIGGTGFPFARITGAQIQKGAVGTFAACVFDSDIAFVGGDMGSSVSVYIGANSVANKIATREIDQILLQYTESELSKCLLEYLMIDGHKFLILHLKDQALVFDKEASQESGNYIWFRLQSSSNINKKYIARNISYVYDKFICGDGDSGKIGYYTRSVSSHYGEKNDWEFSTKILFSDSKGIIFHKIELIALSGRVALGDEPFIYTSYSLDGMTWSQEIPFMLKTIGNRTQKIAWRRQGNMKTLRIQKFKGNSDAHIAFAALDVDLEQLNV